MGRWFRERALPCPQLHSLEGCCLAGEVGGCGGEYLYCIWAGVTARASLSLGAQAQHHLAQLRGATHALNTEGTLNPYNLLLSSSSAPIIECCLCLGK